MVRSTFGARTTARVRLELCALCAVFSVVATVGSLATAQAQATKPSAPRPESPVESSDPQLAPTSDAPVPDQPVVGADQESGITAKEAAPATGYAPQSGGRPQASDGALPDKLELDIGGGLILLAVQPLQEGKRTKNNFEIFEARLRIDAKYGRFRVHITPRFRNTKERDFFPGISWVEEAYIGAVIGDAMIKVGKVYRQFGRFWDNSFMGNVQEYDGLKLDMNHGISVEGIYHEKERFGVGYSAQFFLVDGTTNYSLPGRDTLSIPGARRRNQLVGRVEPFYLLDDRITLKAGLSAEYFQADLPAPTGKQDVGRIALDATFAFHDLTVWAEYTRQIGRHVLDFPFPGIPATDDDPAVPGRSSAHVNYVLVGGEYMYGMFTARYNFSVGQYTDVDANETRHVPGISVTPNQHLMALLEYNRVKQKLGNDKVLVDSGLYLTLHAKF